MERERNTWLGVDAGQLEGIDPKKTAVLVVDMQYLDAHPDYGMGADAKKTGLWSDYESYFQELREIIPRMQQLLEVARRRGCQVVYTAVQAHTVDCRDIGAMHRRFSLEAPAGSKEAQILDELNPQPNDIVLTKTCSGIFNQGEIDQVLRNLGVENLIVVGVMTNFCVEMAVRDACDRNYNVVLVGDLCASVRKDWHELALEILNSSFALVVDFAEVVAELDEAAEVAQPAPLRS